MKGRFGFGRLLICVAGICMVAVTAFAQVPSWTVLVYLDGDNNLEGAGIGDFLEMSSVGSSADLNIVVLFDRIKGYDSSYDNWADARRGIVNLGDVPNTSWGESVGEVNMGDPATLVDFVQWGIQNYPASKYTVILWNHGGGWREQTEKDLPPKAVCWDDTNGGDCLYMKEVRAALSSIESTCGQPDLFCFDACLMGMAEIAYEIHDYAGVMVASEETIPWDGYPYDLFLADLKAAPAMSAIELGTDIVDRYYQSYGNSDPLAAVDLSQMDMLAAQVDTFAGVLRSQWNTDPAACVSAAQDMKTAISSTVIHEQHGGGWPGSHGLAIYFPTSSYYFDPAYNSSEILFPGVCQWEEFLQDFFTSMPGSWVATARNQSQVFYYSENTDLYDFCDKLIANAPVSGPPTLFYWDGKQYAQWGPILEDATSEEDEHMDFAQIAAIKSMDKQYWFRITHENIGTAYVDFSQLKIKNLNLKLLSAKHSKDGNVLSLVQLSDNQRVQIDPGETITISFKAPSIIPPVVSFGVEGYYLDH